MIQKNKNWMLISLGGLAISIVMLFFPVILYKAGNGADNGVLYLFSIIELLNGSFTAHALAEYTGAIVMGRSIVTIITCLLCAIGVAAIVLSGIGLRCMAKQYESVWPFRLTLAGIVCTAIPAIVILIIVLVSGHEFHGTAYPGPYTIVTPLAMAASCITVVKRHQLTQDELRIQNAARQYIRPAGDLPLQ